MDQLDSRHVNRIATLLACQKKECIFFSPVIPVTFHKSYVLLHTIKHKLSEWLHQKCLSSKYGTQIGKKEQNDQNQLVQTYRCPYAHTLYIITQSVDSHLVSLFFICDSAFKVGSHSTSHI